MQLTRRLLTVDPWHEAGHRLMMQFLGLDGQHNAALTHFQRLRDSFQREFNAEPDEVTQAVYEQLRTASSSSPSLTSPILISQPVAASQILHNLHQPLTSLLGRAGEIEAICHEVTNCSYRLITLFGEGGVGKTRLALAVANRIAQSDSSSLYLRTFPDGIWFIPLSDIATKEHLADQLATEIGKAMKLPFSGSQPIFAQLLSHLRQKAVLLLFDNFEHLLPDASDYLIELLQASTTSVALVTSRHILQLSSESTWRVDGLPLPPTTDAQSMQPAMLLRYDSVALFIQRAKQVQPNFALNQDNQSAIVKICHAVAGLPLGIELAAAQTDHFTCEQISQSLQRTLRTLSTTHRDRPIRQRSMEASLIYSWRLLNWDEQQALSACSIFQGGLSSDTAFIVANISTPVLLNLEDKALLRKNGLEFSFHPLVREFVSKQRKDYIDETALFHNHCLYYLNLFATQSFTLQDGEQTMDGVYRQLDNIRQAWRWATSHGYLAQIESTLAAIIAFYRGAGLFQELVVSLSEAIIAVRHQLDCQTFEVQSPQVQDPRHALLGRLLVEQAFFLTLVGQDSEAAALATEGLAIGEQLQIAAIASSGHFTVSLIAERRGNLGLHYQHALAALSWAQTCKMKSLEIRCLSNLGRVLLYLDRGVESLQYFEQSLTLAQSYDTFLECQILGDIGLAYNCLGNFDGAQQALERAFELSKTFSYPALNAWAALNLGDCYMKLGEFEKAKINLNHAQLIYDRLGQRLLLAVCWQRLSRLYLYREDYTAAMESAEQALQLSADDSLYLWHSASLSSYALALLGLERYHDAETAFRQSLNAAQKTNVAGDLINAQAGLAYVRFLQHDLDGALSWVESSLPLPPTLPQQINCETSFTWLTFYRVLNAANDLRAKDILWQAQQCLEEHFSKIADSASRRKFLENVPSRRELYGLISDIPAPTLTI